MNYFFSLLSSRRSQKRRRLKPARATFQVLEGRRLLVAVDLRFATYNVLNFDSASGNRQDEMEIVFEELDADVLVVQEVNTSAGAGILLDALNVNGTEYAQATFVDGPDTDQLLYYRTAKVSLVAQEYISTSLRSIGEYTLSVADTLLNVYSLHLKASSGASNEQQRLNEVTTLRDHLETLPADREFIVAGDMNIQSSSEAAYHKFVQSESNNDGRLEDLLPASLIGNWSANSTYASVHTQSPRTTQFGGGSNGGLDDRFDMIFTSFGLNNGAGLEYVADSQYVPGNDGNHFNQAITSGSNSSASPAVIQALHDASDHLPVVAEFEVISPIGVSITETGGSTSVSEDGTTDSYQLVLDSVPTSNVTVVVTPDSQIDIGNGAGVAVSLTFTPANAQSPQTINISAIDDAIVEGVHTSTITHSATSGDPDYDGIFVESLDVSISDNDGTTASGALLNEVYVNNPGTDSNLEFVELLAEPFSTFDDIWLLEIEGDGSAAGTVDNAQDLSSIVAGANGLVLLGDGYETSHPWTDEVSASTTIANLEGGSMENGTINFLLVSGFSGSVAMDLDANNDGTLDSTPWTVILDGIGWTDGGSSDHVYASVLLTQPGTPDAATRVFGDDLTGSTASWFNGDITSDVAYDGTNSSSNLPSGAIITPGNYNFGATAPGLTSVSVNKEGDTQRSTVDQLVLVFDGDVEFDSGAFNVIQRTDVDGTTTGTSVATSYTTAAVGGNTQVTITFDSMTRNAFGALVDGNYQLTVNGSNVRRTGTDLTLGSNYVYGDTAGEDFYSLYGDSNGDRTVNVFDLLALRQTYLAQAGDANYNASLDFDNNGIVNVVDLLRFRQNYNRSLNFGKSFKSGDSGKSDAPETVIKPPSTAAIAEPYRRPGGSRGQKI
ncbi:endonuclease/exonuclease/phosphatase family protein [Mariniblastus fucicola]|uniref:Endonuclease/Exonuclease/phosphatase family protein n=1 Tax=Mariniblastus fucicola TaxID=980251 RepID=A0A5B9P8M0_9BACT|nr:endonuclease/exonuclease/phosphatase family protein [Mariniblastus fucicola]QEG23077.1 Endonuclease/Exonuclease/phosphatase family protein [Mariniblastus fucicola]